jgi:hypothetical protein
MIPERPDNQYNCEDIFCEDRYNMVTETPSSDGRMFITGYERDLLDDVWVMKWIIVKEA